MHPHTRECDNFFQSINLITKCLLRFIKGIQSRPKITGKIFYFGHTVAHPIFGKNISVQAGNKSNMDKRHLFKNFLEFISVVGCRENFSCSKSGSFTISPSKNNDFLL